jgi:hypothetical protein
MTTTESGSTGATEMVDMGDLELMLNPYERPLAGRTLATDPRELEYEMMPGQWRIRTALPVRIRGARRQPMSSAASFITMEVP